MSHDSDLKNMKLDLNSRQKGWIQIWIQGKRVGFGFGFKVPGFAPHQFRFNLVWVQVQIFLMELQLICGNPIQDDSDSIHVQNSEIITRLGGVANFGNG